MLGCYIAMDTLSVVRDSYGDDDLGSKQTEFRYIFLIVPLRLKHNGINELPLRVRDIHT